MSVLTAACQRTLAAEVCFEGPGLHSGGCHSISIHPAEEGAGIQFRKLAGQGAGSSIPAKWENAVDLPLCTTLSSVSGARIRTIEHLMAAFYACDIDNALVEINGSEVPVLDGSARPFVEGMDKVGTVLQNSHRNLIRIRRRVEVREGARWVAIEPGDAFHVRLGISLAKIGSLEWQGDLDPAVFKREIVAARTFGRLRNGLIAKAVSRFSQTPICLGAGFNSSLVIMGDRPLNSGGLRMPDEYVKHRILDVVGDMMLAGGRLQGKVTGYSTAHRLNRLLLQ
ncbi:MAG: UDP-3-O-[3-hydroxymyristoyl] N-acetylglucosamine deacetylase, partial [Gammaproteobacteria bacterium]|nr:UDP-3-O-[3-hydroxymyristoyl] N-acetylglucosamine deacetylase [Gammaproteobacteria bacterium]